MTSIDASSRGLEDSLQESKRG